MLFNTDVIEYLATYLSVTTNLELRLSYF